MKFLWWLSHSLQLYSALDETQLINAGTPRIPRPPKRSQPARLISVGFAFSGCHDRVCYCQVDDKSAPRQLGCNGAPVCPSPEGSCLSSRFFGRVAVTQTSIALTDYGSFNLAVQPSSPPLARTDVEHVLESFELPHQVRTRRVIYLPFNVRSIHLPSFIKRS
jgi:hypothetical protein